MLDKEVEPESAITYLDFLGEPLAKSTLAKESRNISAAILTKIFLDFNEETPSLMWKKSMNRSSVKFSSFRDDFFDKKVISLLISFSSSAQTCRRTNSLDTVFCS